MSSLFVVIPRLKHLREELFPCPWSVMYYRRVYTWAGHVARMGLYDPSRLTYVVMRFKNYESVLRQSFRGHQGHGGRFCVWRWESQIYSALGANWEVYALGREYWAALLDTLTAWRQSAQWGGPAFYGQLLPTIDPEALRSLWDLYMS